MEGDDSRKAAVRAGVSDRQAAVRAAVGDRVVRRGALVRAGFSDRALRRAVDGGLVRRVGHGLYGPADATAEVPLERGAPRARPSGPAP